MKDCSILSSLVSYDNLPSDFMTTVIDDWSLSHCLSKYFVSVSIRWDENLLNSVPHFTLNWRQWSLSQFHIVRFWTHKGILKTVRMLYRSSGSCCMLMNVLMEKACLKFATLRRPSSRKPSVEENSHQNEAEWSPLSSFHIFPLIFIKKVTFLISSR